ncbi:MAG: VCBS repeat-containing protein, partial [Bacteroidota bacterium]
VEWPGFKVQIIDNVEVDQLIELNIKDAKSFTLSKQSRPDSLLDKAILKPEFIHRENPFIDFDRERLIYHMTSRQGPALAVADLNNDGQEDFFIGGAKNQTSQIYLQGSGSFRRLDTPGFDEDMAFEDVDAIFFDADGDEDLDLYIVSGGSESNGRSEVYQDRLYINEGNKNNPRFKPSENLPTIVRSGSCVEAGDYDQDGDLDLFIGIRGVPGSYGLPEKSFILENDGQGNFKDVTSEKAPQLIDFGMVTDAVWTDYDGDQKLDLVIVGEWMEVTIFKNKGVGFQKAKSIPGLENTKGLWSVVQASDLDADGLPDLVLGNLGLNSRFQADKDHPFQLYINDFDENGSLDHIYAHYQ